ncbi:hypothetical protein EV401DRAFT_2049270, partial [Pisolithus croceorrhizus]
MSHKLLVLSTGSEREGGVFFLPCYHWREGAFLPSAILCEFSFQSFYSRNNRLERRFRHVNHLPALGRPLSSSCVPIAIWSWLRARAMGLVLQCGPSVLLHQAGSVCRMMVTHGSGMVPPSRDAARFIDAGDVDECPRLARTQRAQGEVRPAS